MFSIRIQQYSIVNRHKKTSVSSLQINNIREGFNPKNCKNGYEDSFSPLLPSGNVVLEKQFFFSEEDEDCDGMR